METIRQTTLYPAKVILEARDHYNDYSVRADHFLTVEDRSVGYFRQWALGADRIKAIRAYDVAVNSVYQAQFKVAAPGEDLARAVA